MGACQPTQLMTITNFVIVISLCAQLNLLICRDEGRELKAARLVAGARQLGTLRTAWLARKREWAGLAGSGPTYLAPDIYRICQKAGVARSHTYSLACMSSQWRRSSTQSCGPDRGPR
jgi:hypothetical protein